VVGVPDPLGSQLDRHPGYRLGGQDAPADPVAGLEEDGLLTRCEDLACGDEPRQAGADDDHVRFPFHAAPELLRPHPLRR
jgi:hypothetical protein